MIQVVTPGSSGLPINQPLGTGNESGVNASGALSVIKFTGISSDIGPAPGFQLCTAYNGDVIIEEVIFSVAAGGLQGAGSLQLGTDDPVGVVNFFGAAVSALNTQTTTDFFTTAGSHQRRQIQQGYHVFIRASVSQLTGVVPWALYIISRGLTPQAVLA